jgi:hypothetical protein
MSKEPRAIDRRRFLATTAGLSTYSLFVCGPGIAEAGGEERSPEEIRDSFETLAPSDPAAVARRLEGEPHMTLVDLQCDLLVAGGGPSGVCAALAAARHGARVILVQDRSRLGGNSSSEVKMHIVGANNHRGRPGWREGGLIEELRLDDAANNPQRSWELWDLLLYDKVVSEPGCTLLLDTSVYAAEVQDGLVQRVMARCDKTEHLYRIRATHFADCTGDARLALEAGATLRWGREARDEFRESLAAETASRTTLGSSILFTARDHGRPMPFSPPKWARRIEEKHLRFRPVGSLAWEYGYWWIEWGGVTDTIRDNERIRFELLAIVTGVWDHIKNSGRFPEAETWAMEWIGMVPGKRESRRVEGDHILTQADLEGRNPPFDDAVCIGGWPLDDHPSGGFDLADQEPFTSIPLPQVYNIPLRALYSRDLGNLFMAGRNASCSHVAFSSTRVMATCAGMGQAVGTAAALCARHGLRPRQLYEDKARLRELQQVLLRDDQTIRGVGNEDPGDVARQATVRASGALDRSRPESVIDGWVRNPTESGLSHRWVAPLEGDGAGVELAWATPRPLAHIQLTFDTGFHRELTLTASDGHNSHMIRAPQPETVRDYTIVVRTPEGREVEVARVEGNHQRLRRHDFEAIEASAVVIHVTATNGSENVSLYEVRCYSPE